MSDNATADHTRIRSALQRYRVMAVITGSFLLLVVVDMIVKYGGEWLFDWRNDAFVSFSSIVAVVHGWIYVVYLITCVDLWTRMKWSLGRGFYMAMGGVVPLLSFYAERRIAAEVADSLEP